MSNVSNPTASIAVVAALVLSGIGAGLPIDSAAAADSCAAAPSAGAPQGQHWYYHVDRATHRKCWYLHATVALAHHATAAEDGTAETESPGADPVAAQLPAIQAPSATIDPPAETDSVAPPSPSNADSALPASPSAPPAEAAPAAPRVTVLTVKTVPEPFVDAAAPSQQRPPEGADPPAMRQAPLSGANTADNDGVNPPQRNDQTPPSAAPDIADHPEPAPTIDAASAAARKRSGELFLMLALGLGIAAGFVALLSKMIGPYRTPRFADDPDAAWIRYRNAQRLFEDAAGDEQDVPFLDPEPEHGLAGFDEPHWIGQPSPAETRGSTAPAEPPSVKDIELALRILRQARQSRVA